MIQFASQNGFLWVHDSNKAVKNTFQRQPLLSQGKQCPFNIQSKLSCICEFTVNLQLMMVALVRPRFPMMFIFTSHW